VAGRHRHPPSRGRHAVPGRPQLIDHQQRRAVSQRRERLRGRPCAVPDNRVGQASRTGLTLARRTVAAIVAAHRGSRRCRLTRPAGRCSPPRGPTQLRSELLGPRGHRWLRSVLLHQTAVQRLLTLARMAGIRHWRQPPGLPPHPRPDRRNPADALRQAEMLLRERAQATPAYVGRRARTWCGPRRID
jgi:hypothetical protein